MTGPTAKGLAGAVSRAIADGALGPGTKLPPIRTIAASLTIAPATVAAAWDLLARSGAIRTDGRRGTTVLDNRNRGPARYRRALEHATTFALDLSTGVPDARLLPDLKPALQDLTSAATPGSYLDEPVVPELLAVLRGDWPYEAEQFTVVDGAMDALDLIAHTRLRFGDRVIVEHPCFPPLIDLLEAIGVEIVGVPVDDESLEPAALAAALTTPAAAIFLQPRGHNPTGVSLTRRRARALAELLRRHDSVVVEDDSVGAISSATPISLGSWLPERTIHIRSFAKSHGPDLRLAAVGGPEPLISAIVGRRQLGQGWSSRLLQRVLLHLLTDTKAQQQVKRARTEYQRRGAALRAALLDAGIAVRGNDGLNLWVPVADETAATVRLASQGVGVAPGSPFEVLADSPPHVRVTVGLVSAGHEELAAQLAAAARAGSGIRAR